MIVAEDCSFDQFWFIGYLAKNQTKGNDAQYACFLAGTDRTDCAPRSTVFIAAPGSPLFGVTTSDLILTSMSALLSLDCTSGTFAQGNVRATAASIMAAITSAGQWLTYTANSNVATSKELSFSRVHSILGRMAIHRTNALSERLGLGHVEAFLTHFVSECKTDEQ
jgi:hypothetical protein